KAALEVPEMLQKPLPTSAAAYKAEREREAREVLKSYRQLAGETIFSVQTTLLNAINAWWNNVQKTFDASVQKNFGPAALSIKSWLDWFCRTIFIDLIVWPLFVILSIPIGFLAFLYNVFNFIGQAEHLRRNAVEVPMHANYLLKIARLFKNQF